MSQDGLALMETMLERGILFEDEAVIWFGPEGERSFGRRHFSELLAVFASDPMISVRHGAREIGQVHPLTFTGTNTGHPLSLGGRAWKVLDIDWPKRVASVEPAAGAGKARWIGDARPLGFEFARACRSVIAGDLLDPAWSARARDAMAELRDDLSFLDRSSTVAVNDADGRCVWWTFGGLIANEQLAGWLRRALRVTARADNLTIKIDQVAPAAVAEAVAGLAEPPPFAPEGPQRLAERLKFRECLPEEALGRLLRARYGAEGALRLILREPCRALVTPPPPARAG
jgi:ATP-dependent Lhr-like helicase